MFKRKKWLTYLVLTVFAVFVFFPVFWMMSISFRSNGEVFQYPLRLLPETLTLEAYQKVLNNPSMVTYLYNSYLNGFIVTVVATVVGIMAGYGLSRYQFRGKNLFNSFVISTQTIPSVTLIIPFFVLMVTYHIYGKR